MQHTNLARAMYRSAEVIHLGETTLKIKPTDLPLGTTQFFSMITTALRCQTRIGGLEEEIKAAAIFSEASTLYMVSEISKCLVAVLSLFELFLLNNQYYSGKQH